MEDSQYVKIRNKVIYKPDVIQIEAVHTHIERIIKIKFSQWNNNSDLEFIYCPDEFDDFNKDYEKFKSLFHISKVR